MAPPTIAFYSAAPAKDRGFCRIIADADEESTGQVTAHPYTNAGSSRSMAGIASFSAQ